MQFTACGKQWYLDFVFCQSLNYFQAYKQLFTFTYKMYGLGFNAIVVFVLFGVCPNLKDEQTCLKRKTIERIKG